VKFHKNLKFIKNERDFLVALFFILMDIDKLLEETDCIQFSNLSNKNESL